MRRKTLLWMLLLGAVALAPLASRAGGHDDDEEDGDERHEAHHPRPRGRDLAPRPLGDEAALRATPGWALYAGECGGCHLAYPPRLLPARSWEALLSGLEDHFGQDATLDAATRAQLADFLKGAAADAGGGRRAARVLRSTEGTTPLRITQLAYWRREHDELSPAVFRREAVGSAANCTACHRGAEQGVFDEHDVRVPRDPAPGARLPSHAAPAR